LAGANGVAQSNFAAPQPFPLDLSVALKLNHEATSGFRPSPMLVPCAPLNPEDHIACVPRQEVQN
jgi:hypothetical protein